MLSTLEILKDLVSIPSYFDGENDESNLVRYITRLLFVDAPYLSITALPVEGKRANLIISDGAPAKLILFSHLDTVLPKASTPAPFNPTIENGKLYGLGAVDTKSGVALALSQILKGAPRRGLWVVLTVDEEYEFKGALALAKAANFPSAPILNLEPTNLKILNGCRGITEFSLVVHGKSCHSGRKQLGVNAIEKAVKLCELFQAELSKLDATGISNSSLNLAFLHGGVLVPTPTGAKQVSGLGMVVPDFAELNCEIRIGNRTITRDYIVETLARLATDLGISLSDFSFKFLLGTMHTPRSELALFEECLISAGLPIEYQDIGSAGYYEVQLLQEKFCSPAFAFGVGPKEMSHCANEYVDLTTLAKAEEVLDIFLRRVFE